MEIVQRYRGCLLGLAVGDAVGAALEFRSPGSFRPITDMIGGGPFDLVPGQWTDDTSMALCLAESLIENKGFNAEDQMRRYVRWWKEGYLSSTGTCFDIGNATWAALSRFIETGDPLSGSIHPNSAGNGSLMRLAPVPMFYARDPGRAIEFAAESSKTTHRVAAAVDACRYFSALIVGALNGATREELMSDHYCPVKGYWKDHPLAPAIREVAAGSFRQKNPPEIQGTGHVVRSLEAALWAFHKSTNFREGCLMAANLGDDADTTAAIYGQLAGAFYGDADIPQSWIEKLSLREKILEFADRLLALSAREGIRADLPGDPFAGDVHELSHGEAAEVPIGRSYWVVPGKLLAGAYPGDVSEEKAKEKLRSFIDAGIRCFVDLTCPGDRNLVGQAMVPYEDLLKKVSDGNSKVIYRRMSVVDLDIPTRPGMMAILDLIDGAISENLPVYVHCVGGIGRTGTVIGCWLVRHRIEKGKGAVDLIRKLRRNEAEVHRVSPETAAQHRFILEWQPGD